MLEYQSDLEKFSNSIFIPDKNLVIIKQNIELSWLYFYTKKTLYYSINQFLLNKIKYIIFVFFWHFNTLNIIQIICVIKIHIFILIILNNYINKY